MKRLITAIAALLVGSGALASTPAVVADNAAPCVRVRDQPHTNADTIACIPPGTTIEVLEVVPYWRKVQLPDNTTGWAAKKYLTDLPPGLPAAEQWLEVHVIDVGQGDAIWIHTPDDALTNGKYEGRNLFIDGGPDASDKKNAALAYLESRAHHDAVIDALIVTHPHDDHYPGAEGILRHFDVRRYYDPGFPKTGPAYAAFLKSVNEEPGCDVMMGQSAFKPLDLGAEITAEFLWSYPGNNAGLGRESTLENNASIVLRLQYGDVSFLFMGDAEGKDRANPPTTPKYVEKQLLEHHPDKLKATVLKIAHHGSETSSTIPFIEAVDPEIVIVPSGRRSYNHRYLPDATTLRRYCCHNQDIRIYRTDAGDEASGLTASNDADGDHIILRTNGTTITVEAYDHGNPITTDTCTPTCNE